MHNNLWRNMRCFALLCATILPLLAHAAPKLPCIAVKLSGDKPVVRHYPSLDAVPGGHQDIRYKTEWMLLVRLPEGSNKRDDSTAAFTISRPFYCSVYEVTQAQWEHVIGSQMLDISRPSYFSNPEHWQTRPVERVSWNDVRGNTGGPADDHTVDALSFMGSLRKKTGQQFAFDLPTEAQWEYACRAGTTGPWNNGAPAAIKDHRDPVLDTLGRYAHNGGMVPDGTPAMKEPEPHASTDHGTATVGSYPPNAWGLYDMHGNVMEWCRDWFAEAKDFGELLSGRDPAGPASGTVKVVRGGGWWNFLYGGADACTSSSRTYARYPSPGLRQFAIGFRVVAPVDPETATAQEPRPQPQAKPATVDGSILRPRDRVLFLGDSITELSVHPMGYFTQLKQTVKEVYPEYQNEFAAMGFSGHTVFSWRQGILPDSRVRNVKASGNFDVHVELGKPADIVFILLGMNDILKPTISDTEASTRIWAEGYRDVIREVRARVSPREVFLCDITPLTEDPESPKNRQRARLSRALDTLAKEEGCRRVKTADSLFECVTAARRIRPKHNVIPDTVHPNTYEGNAAIVRALARALNDKPLLGAIEAKITGYLAKVKELEPVAVPSADMAARPGWRVLCLEDVYGVFAGANYLPQNAVPAIEQELIKGQFGRSSKWQVVRQSPDYTDGLNPDAITPYQLVAGTQRDLLYAHRWVYSEKEREVEFNFSTRTFASRLGCVLWVNGIRAGQIYPVKRTTPPLRATLKQGWNRILVRNDHENWQRQFTCSIQPLEKDDLSRLRYSNSLKQP